MKQTLSLDIQEEVENSAKERVEKWLENNSGNIITRQFVAGKDGKLYPRND